jgi:hypothetical protein
MANHTGKRGGPVDVASEKSDGSPVEDEVNTPSRKKKGKDKGKTVNSRTINVDNDEESYSLLGSSANARSALGAKNLQRIDVRAKDRKQKSATLSDDSSDGLDLPIRGSKGPAMKRNALSKAAKEIQVDVDEDESEDEPPVVTSSQRRPSRLIVADDSDSDELPVLGQLSTRSRGAARYGASADNRIEIEDDSDEIVTTSPSKRRRRVVNPEASHPPVSSPLKRRIQLVEESEDTDDVVSSPLKRRRQLQEEDEDEVDDDDLPSLNEFHLKRDAANNGSTTKTRTPTRHTRQQRKPQRHRTEKEKKLELLKRRRAGENIEEYVYPQTSSSILGVFETFP